tara:strand:- start:16576 stop:18522 length:1947 start_codon:yes stop_codon:yes gene_type:complete
MIINRIKFKPKKLDFYHYRLLVSLLKQNGISRSEANKFIDKKSEQENIIGISVLLLEHLAKLQWKIEIIRNEIYIVSPKDFVNLKGRMEYKRELQEMFRVGKFDELSEKGIYNFINSLEFPQIHNNKKVSIFSIIEDGQDLHQQLKKIKKIENKEEKISAIKEIIQPEIEFPNAKDKCDVTGISTNSIWKYFRYGWTLPQKSIPARTLQFMVRNKAMKNKPVMGIGSLTNAVLNLNDRDKKIGLNPRENLKRISESKEFYELFRSNSTKVLKNALQNTRSDDFDLDLQKDDESKISLMKYHLDKLQELRNEELSGKIKKSDNVTARNIPKLENGQFDWKKRSEQALFKLKRATKIYEILSSRKFFSENNYEDIKDDIYSSSDSGEIKNGALYSAVYVVNNLIKGDVLSENIFDLNVCGGIQPFSPLLAGKLVALSIFSSEIRNELSSRYKDMESEIASSTAGRAFIRQIKPLGFTTTSLYETGSSQYNRLYFENSKTKYKWEEIGMSEGSSNVYFSSKLSAILTSYLKKHKGFTRSNAIFGEGAGAAFRKINEAMRLMGIDSSIILNHKSKRIIYAAMMSENLDFASRSEYQIKYDCSFEEIVDFWMQRYLLMRIENNEVLKNISLFKSKSILESFDVPRPKGTAKLL